MPGSVPGYACSKALAQSGIAGDADKLDRWLSNPSGFVPGSKTGFRVADLTDRAKRIGLRLHAAFDLLLAAPA